MTQLIATVSELRAALAQRRALGAGHRVGLVPTMGALHAGHLSLMGEARKRADTVVVSIFVNPAQFAPNEDFEAYPRNLEADVQKLTGRADIVFAPSAAEIYPEGFATSISVEGPSVGLETDVRPHFFSGVATVVAKLLIAAGPDMAVFGEKDYQQLLVIKRLVQDLTLPVEIVGVPTLREADGLAMSSRNAYLSSGERRIAGKFNVILKEAALKARNTGDLRGAEASTTIALWNAGLGRADYVTIRDAQNLEPLAKLDRPARILAAAKIGKTRLIDNMVV